MDVIIVILLVAAVVSGVVGELADTFNRLFDTVALGAGDLAICVGVAQLIFLVVEAEKFLRHRKPG